MIRVKVFGIREMFIKFLYYIALILALYLLLIIIFKLINNQSKRFALEIVESSIDSEVICKNDLNMKLIQSELSIYEKSKKKASKVIYDYNENNTIISDEKNDEIINEEDEHKYISKEEIMPQNRPSTYEVKELPSGKIQVGNVYINNYSKLKLDYSELSKVSKFEINDKTNILIYHTHTSEAYEEAGNDSNFRTTDDNYNVVAVGNTLKENLLLKNFNTYQCITKHDTPSYNGAYSASLETIQNILKREKYDIIIDLHRDALSGNLHFRPTTQINGETAAKLMFVIGTDASGLEHPNWMNNLKLALLIQNTAEEMYPGLFRDLNLSKSRYNQHIGDGAFIIEVGATGNTLSDTKTAMKYLSNVIASLKE